VTVEPAYRPKYKIHPRKFHTYAWPLEPNQTVTFPYREHEEPGFRATTRILSAARYTYLYRARGLIPHARHTPEGIEFYWETTSVKRSWK
jgi:hypothetical protein